MNSLQLLGLDTHFLLSLCRLAAGSDTFGNVKIFSDLVYRISLLNCKLKPLASRLLLSRGSWIIEPPSKG